MVSLQVTSAESRLNRFFHQNPDKLIRYRLKLSTKPIQRLYGPEILIKKLGECMTGIVAQVMKSNEWFKRNCVWRIAIFIHFCHPRLRETSSNPQDFHYGPEFHIFEWFNNSIENQHEALRIWKRFDVNFWKSLDSGIITHVTRQHGSSAKKLEQRTGPITSN